MMREHLNFPVLGKIILNLSVIWDVKILGDFQTSNVANTEKKKIKEKRKKQSRVVKQKRSQDTVRTAFLALL